MYVHIEILHDRESIRKLLKHDRWHFDPAGGEESFLAYHPTVTDEASARCRLNESGLLTSRVLRIEFFPGIKTDQGGRPGLRKPRVRTALPQGGNAVNHA